jgi:O-antigen/teichoic acid export membrane protein
MYVKEQSFFPIWFKDMVKYLRPSMTMFMLIALWTPSQGSLYFDTQPIFNVGVILEAW